MDKGTAFYVVLITLLTIAGIAAFYYVAMRPEAYDLEPKAGISGTVMLGPTCPGPERIGEVCEAPYQANISIKDENGREIALIKSDASGKFKVSLPPGTYVVEPLQDGRYPARPERKIIVVEPREFTETAIYYDTGIR